MRIRTIFLLFLSVYSLRQLEAQSSRADLHFTPDKAPGWQSPALPVPLQQPEPFIALSLAWEGEARSFDVRFSSDGQRWSEWARLHLDPHGEQSPERYVSELYFADANSRFVQFRATGPAEELQAHFYNPGKTIKKEGNDGAAATFRGPEFCPCPLPEYEERADWCPDGTCPPNPSPSFTDVTHLIVHHSAGTNTATDWAAVVRSIWDFHVITRGWSDIGYNYLIAPTGAIYEGRGNDILGAHFCGTNGSTMGVCMMGDYTDITPTAGALDALRELLAWKACDVNVDPLGMAFHGSSNLTLNNISGHRDGCATQCPGNAFYPMLPEVRQSVADYIASSCAAIAPPQQLTATPVSETEVLLEWNDISENETAFLIERSRTFNDGYEQVASAGENANSYTDTGLEPQTGYFYRVRSANEQDTSAYSNRAFVFTQVVGLDGPLSAAHVRLFPNPTGNRLTVALDSELNGAVHLRLLDATGREAWRAEMQGGRWSVDIPMIHLSGGLYLLQLQSGKTTAAFKVIRE